MADAAEIYLDISTPQGGSYKSLDSRDPFTLGPFIQGQAIPFRIYPVVATGRLIPPGIFQKVAIDNMTFHLVYGPRAGGTSILVAQYDWAKQLVPDPVEGKSGYFYATFDLNQTELNTAIGTEDSITRFLEFRLSRGVETPRPVHQVEVKTIASVLDPSSAAAVPTPTPSYLTAAQCYEMFVMWNNQLRAGNAGRMPILVSPNGAHTRELGVDDAGVPVENLN